ncbi:hypothetical protein IWW36_001913 [Coemansia brasiliensis]|uniref:DNA 5'-3' helicase n=1 Tax=Coemansia brasiliensis TaxID=2650707 RepID=A0A9W8ID23_9FUNG|nr:hypothetical protein IWW36_001913 [Coemansia brasiliensis]
MSPKRILSRQSSADNEVIDTKNAIVTEPIRIDHSVPTKTYYIGGVQVHFPFAPYPSQLGMMNHMIGALTKSKNTMIESPTGSGKSLALLCAVLAWRRSLIAKQKKLSENVKRIVMNFGMHNPLLLKDRYGNMDDPSDAAAAETQPDEKSSNADKTPADIKQEVEEKPKVHTDDQDENAANNPNSQNKDTTKNAKNEAPKVSIGLLIATAMIKREETVSFILDMAKSRTLEGVSPDDIAVLQDFKNSGIKATYKPRIYFGSRTHKQVSQLVDELRRKTPYRLRTAVLGSRSQTCIHNRREKIENESVEEMCHMLRDEDKCDPYSNYRLMAAHKKIMQGGELEIWDLEDLVQLGRKIKACPYYASRELADSADLVFCPYNYILDPTVREAAGINLKNSIIIFDEAHNIENAARNAGSYEVTDKALSILTFECAKMIENNKLVKEHRLIMALAESLVHWLQDEDNEYEYQDYETYTSVWPKQNYSVERLLDYLMLTPGIVKKVKTAHGTIEDYIRKLRQDKSDSLCVKKLRSNGINSGDEENWAEPEAQFMRHLSSSSMRTVGGLLRMLENAWPGSKFAGDYRIAIIRYPNPEAHSDHQQNGRSKRNRRLGAMSKEIPPYLNTLAFWCMNPGVIFREISELSWSVVLTSGTLSPLESYASELQVEFASTLEASHVIHPSRFCALSVQCGPSGAPLEAKYKTADQLAFQDDMGEAIMSITKICPDGMLVFAPSYALLNKLFARWENTGVLAEIKVHKEVFIEPQGGSSSEFDKLLKAFRSHLYKSENLGQPSPRGAIIFAVYRGKVSEGIDFSDYFCRTVVNIGIPYPAFKDVQIILKREYNDAHSSPKVGIDSRQLLNGSKWYNIQAFRAINQALGRCLRHKNDWGAIIMLESRFSYPWNISQLSKWVRGSLNVYFTLDEAQTYLKAFYQERIHEDLNSETVTEDMATLGLIED